MHHVNVGEGITFPHAMCKDGVRMMRSKTVCVREDNIFPYEQTVRDGVRMMRSKTVCVREDNIFPYEQTVWDGGNPAGCYCFTSTLVISQI